VEQGFWDERAFASLIFLNYGLGLPYSKTSRLKPHGFVLATALHPLL